MTKIADKFKRLVIKVFFICQHFLFLLCRWSSDITLVTQYRLGLVRSGCKYFTLGFTNPLPIFFNLCALCMNPWQLQININNTQKLPGTNLATPESFIPIDPTNEKLINNLISTEKMLTTWPPGTPRGASNQKTKKYLSLKIYFRRGTFNK